MNKQITFNRLGIYELKIIGLTLLIFSVISLIMQRTEIISFLPGWLVNWSIVLSLTLINFSKEKFETNKIEIFRLQAMYLSSMTVIGLIISFGFVSGVFHLTESIEPMVIAFIFNIIFMVTYQIQKIIGIKVDKIENSNLIHFNMTVGNYLVWGVISALALTLLFVLF